MEKKDWYKVEIRELIRKNLGKIHRKVGDSYGIDVSYLHKMISDYATQELDKAREEGYKKGREDQQHLDGLLYVTTVATTTTLEEGWKLKDPKELKKELSKLTTK